MSKFSNWLRSKGLLAPKPAKPESFPFGYHEEEIATWREASPFTMTDKRRILCLIHAVRYIEKNQIPGDIVECGVWKGGSMLVAARTLKNLGSTGRVLYLYDTYQGMPAPTDADVGDDEYDAHAHFNRTRFEDREGSDWCYSPLDEVKHNVGLAGYPEVNLRFVVGKVEDTLPKTKPERIALLRLDTDWYESTLAEMDHLWPLLQPGGVIIIDDYLYWRGSRKAVDEYIEREKLRLLLNPIDGGGVIGVKLA